MGSGWSAPASTPVLAADTKESMIMNTMTMNTNVVDTNGATSEATSDYDNGLHNGKLVVKSYDSENPPTGNGKRVVPLLYRAKGGKPAKRDNAYILLEHVTEEDIAEHFEELLPFFLRYVEDTQDTIAKEDHSAFGSINMDPAMFTIPAVLEYLDSKGKGQPITKEIIEEWYSSEMQDTLYSLLFEKLGDEQKATAVNEVYKAKFVALAGNASYIPDDAKKLEDAMIKCGASNTRIGKKLGIKLQKMQQKDEDLLLAL